MLAKALRGVRIGVDKDLAVGETAELDPQTFRFLRHIGAVEEVIDAPVEESENVKSGKAGRSKE
jgi:hypothetical protein